MRKRTEAQKAAEKRYQAKTDKVSYFRKVRPEHVKPLDAKLEELVTRLEKAIAELNKAI